MNDHADPAAQAPPRTLARAFLLGGLAVAFLGFIALGAWQLERRAWKLDLIERVDARVHAPPVAPPGPGEWASVGAARDEYRNVVVTGRFLPGRASRVQAVTSLGPGFWLLAPLQRDDGSVVLVNRGFITSDWTSPRSPAEPPEVKVTGLLRLTEPGGGFLRRNVPAQGRWYSRDVQAIAAAQGLSPVAPYFIDAGPTGRGEAIAAGGANGPVGGLTVVSFRNQHLQYALTWFALALMVVAAAWRVLREERRRSTQG